MRLNYIKQRTQTLYMQQLMNVRFPCTTEKKNCNQIKAGGEIYGACLKNKEEKNEKRKNSP